MPELTRDQRGTVDLALLSQIVEGAFAGVMVTTVPLGSEEARIVYANPEVVRMTGFTADEPFETLGEKLSLPPNYEQYREQVEKVLAPLPNPRAARR